MSTTERRLSLSPVWVLLIVALLAGALVNVVPFLWMLSTSLKVPSQVFAYPPQWIPAASSSARGS